MIKIHCCLIVWNKLNLKKKVFTSQPQLELEIEVDFLILPFEERSRHMWKQERRAVI